MLYIRVMTDDVVCDLASRECVPCRGGIPPLTPEQRQPLLEQLSGWQVVDGHHLKKEYAFENFVDALAFVNRVGAVAEYNGHHPDGSDAESDACPLQKVADRIVAAYAQVF